MGRQPGAASQHANATRASYAYDDAGRLTLLANFKSDGTTISSFNYALDNVGNRSACELDGGVRVTRTYDDAYRLTREQRDGANSYDVTYTYDPAGNRTVKLASALRTTYTYDAANQLATEQRLTIVITTSYDGNGNMLVTSTNVTGPLITMTWDDEDRMKSVDYTSMDLAYTAVNDGDDRRVAWSYTTDGETDRKKCVWDQADVLVRTDESDVTEAVFTLEPSFYGNLLSQRSGGATYCYHFDGVGSTSQLTDASPDVVNAYIYLAFGEIIDKQEAVDNEFRYVGQLGYQGEVDLYTYVRRRYYAASYGRWLSRDPLGYVDGRNLYEYVRSNAIRYVDPSGERVWLKKKPTGKVQWTKTKKWYYRGQKDKKCRLYQIYVGQGIVGYILLPLGHDPGSWGIKIVDALEDMPLSIKIVGPLGKAVNIARHAGSQDVARAKWSIENRYYRKDVLVSNDCPEPCKCASKKCSGTYNELKLQKFALDDVVETLVEEPVLPSEEQGLEDLQGKGVEAVIEALKKMIKKW